MPPEQKQKSMRWIAAVLAVGGVVTLLLLYAGSGRRAKDPESRLARSTSSSSSVPTLETGMPVTGVTAPPESALIKTVHGENIPELYRDITAQSGIQFTYRNAVEQPDDYAILDTLGGGVAVLDYDGDGLMDLFITGGGKYASRVPKHIVGRGNRLFKNLGNWKFRDVTREAGLEEPSFYSHGCAVADFNRDGWPDLLVTGWGRVVLYRNESNGKGGRRFVDVTREAGLDDKLWSTSAAWADLDGDGFPDLYICHYVNWSLDNDPKCPGRLKTARRDVCTPRVFDGLPHTLYRNNGNGTFTDVSRHAGLRPYTGTADKDREPGKGLGVVIADLGGDAKPDIFVANDTVDDFLYRNESTPGKLRFAEVGLASGVARDDRGTPTGSMGVDVADETGSGRPSLFVTCYESEFHSLFRNRGRGLFVFSTPVAGIGKIGQMFVGFGTAFIDLDNDGWEDLVIANGHVLRHGGMAPAEQRAVLLRNVGSGQYVDISAQGGGYFHSLHMGRGLAAVDLNNRGRLDLVISNLNEAVVVLQNQADGGFHWLGIELTGKERRDVAGARIVVRAGEQSWTRFAKGGGSYLSSSDRRHLFGLGKTDHIDTITVYWPFGPAEHWDALAVDRYWRLTEGRPEAEQSGKAIDDR
jgi:hypothetical protein